MIQSQVTDAMTELLALRDRSVGYDADKHDHIMRCGDMKFNAEFGLELPAETWGALPPVAPTEWAARQLYAKLGPGHFGQPNKILPYDYLTAHSPRIRSILVNGHVKADTVADRSYMVRCYQDQARAVLHEKYPAIPCTDMLDAVIDAINGNALPDMKLCRPHLDQDRVIMRIRWLNTNRPDGGGGYYGLGTFIMNDEIGSGRVKVLPHVYRSSCDNSMIIPKFTAGEINGQDLMDTRAYDEEQDPRQDLIAVSAVHRGDKARLLLTIKQAISASMGAGAEFIEKLIVAQTMALPDFAEVLADLAKKNRWTDNVKTAVAVGSEGKQTVAGLLNGITWAAKTLESPVDQVDMEMYAGSFLVDPNSLFGKAARAREYVTVR